MTKDWRIVAAILIGGDLLTLARRKNNKDSSAGEGVAAWTIVITIAYLL